MQFRLVDRLPTARQRVRQLGRLSRDATAAFPMRRFSRVFPAAIREEQRVRGGARSDLRSRSQLLRKLDAKSKSLHTGRNFLQEIPNLSLFALVCKDWALEDDVLWSA
eukprot:4785257-Amphidinium_carterae.1